jgi:hypothetical protein
MRRAIDNRPLAIDLEVATCLDDVAYHSSGALEAATPTEEVRAEDRATQPGSG